MNDRRISKIRLAVNAIGCLVIAGLCLPVGLPGAIGLIIGSLHFGTDPDGADKVLGIQLVSTFFGAIALVSLARTVRQWRAWRDT